MLQFQSQPPMESTKSAFRLLRTPTRGKLELYITSPDLIGCWTHFWTGRTVPCTGPDCEACQAGSSSRWHGYVAAVDVKTSEPVVFETTANAAEQLASYRTKNATLRGCHCLASRTSPRPNARVRLLMKPLDLAHTNLPQPMNLQAALCHIWGIPVTETTIAHCATDQNLIQHRGPGLPTDPGNGKSEPLKVPRTGCIGRRNAL